MDTQRVGDPFRIEGPAVVSFSGGRTSGYMLWRILQAHGGTLPEDVRVIFCNTGKEAAETLDFVQECSDRWSVPVVWLEYVSQSGFPQFAVVDRATASTQGEPFDRVIRDRGYLPNPVTRFCSSELKTLTTARYMRAIGQPEYQCAVGFRSDEPVRLWKLRANPSGGTAGVERIAPLAEAGIANGDVLAFWKAHPFDLRLISVGGKTLEGNCDLCFMKGARQVLALANARPSRLDWWARQEAAVGRPGAIKGNGAMFRSDRPSYAAMQRFIEQQGSLDGMDETEVLDCACTD